MEWPMFILTVSRFDLARAFYGKLLPEFGMKPIYDGDRFFYCVGARTATSSSRRWAVDPTVDVARVRAGYRPVLHPDIEENPHF
jgi:hypothetical protein